MLCRAASKRSIQRKLASLASCTFYTLWYKALQTGKHKHKHDVYNLLKHSKPCVNSEAKAEVALETFPLIPSSGWFQNNSKILPISLQVSKATIQLLTRKSTLAPPFLLFWFLYLQNMVVTINTQFPFIQSNLMGDTRLTLSTKITMFELIVIRYHDSKVLQSVKIKELPLAAIWYHQSAELPSAAFMRGD